MQDVIELNAGAMRARITRRGAEMLQLSRHGRDVLWTPDPSVWADRCSVLFPAIGRSENDEIRVDGRTYPMPMHGFAKDSTFEVTAQTPSHCSLLLISNTATMRHYPFAFALCLQYDLTATCLRVTAKIFNPGHTTLPAAFGLHPGFRWPLNSLHRKEDYCLSFPDDAVLTYTRPCNRQIGPDRYQLETGGGTLSLSEALFAESGLIFLSPKSRSLHFHSAGGAASVRLSYPGFSQLILWMRPGSDFLCIEPCRGFADPVGFSGEFCEKPGITMIKAGESLQLRITIEPDL